MGESGYEKRFGLILWIRHAAPSRAIVRIVMTLRKRIPIFLTLPLKFRGLIKFEAACTFFGGSIEDFLKFCPAAFHLVAGQPMPTRPIEINR